MSRDDLDQVDHGRLGALGPAEREEALGEAGAAIGRALDRLGFGPFRIVRLEHHRQQLRRSENGRENVVEVVRDAAGKAANRVHLLRLAQLVFERQARRDVPRNGLHADRRPVLLDDLHALPEP